MTSSPDLNEDGRPLWVDIAGWHWTIGWVEEHVWEKDPEFDSGNSGETWGSRQAIWVRLGPNYAELTVREIFFHELMHACLQTTGHTYLPRFLKKQDWEETFVSGLSPALFAVLRNNDHVRDYLLAD